MTVNGSYMISFGLQNGNHKKKSAVRTISFMPSGISTNHVMDYLISNIMKGATDGFSGEEAERSSIRIFLDVCSFLVDYRSASQVIGVMRHSAGAPCILSTFGTNIHVECPITHTHHL